VVGVVKDYHQNSLYDAIEPIMVILSDENYLVLVRTELKEIFVSHLLAVEKRVERTVPESYISV
jgi:putative ABC transport system permease protein